MKARFAFAAQFWGNGAVVCRAVEDRPGPVVEPQFGEFKSWTQAQDFAAKLNEGLDLGPRDVRQIVTSSLLATACVVQEALNSRDSWKGSRVELTARATQLQFMLSELALAITLCRTAALVPDGPAPRFLANVQKVLHNSARFIKIFDGDDFPELREVASRTQALHAALQQASAACLPACLDQHREKYAPGLNHWE